MIVSEAISNEEFSSLLINHSFVYEKNPSVAVSFSGGSDSLALVILMNNWIKKHKGFLTLIYFDHKLRKGSYLESQYAKELSKKLGINHKILTWNEEKPKNSIMQKAREMRYEKIISFCKQKKIMTVMTAHHLDDSLETYFMKKKRNSLTPNLAGIPFKNTQDQVQILRPLINLRKSRLIQTCEKNKFKWFEDPSNQDKNFERVRVRNIIGGLSKYKRSQLYSEFKVITYENKFFEIELANFFMKNLEFEDYGKFIINKKEFKYQNKCLQIEILKRILVTCSGSVYSPRSRSIKFFLDKYLKLENVKFTIHSCIVECYSDKIYIFREYVKTKRSNPKQLIIKKKKSVIWDNRFLISSIFSDIKCLIFDDIIWLKLKKQYKFVKDTNNIPYDILKTLPVLLYKNKMMIPFLTNNEIMMSFGISVIFKPKIPLTKKNL